jgi:hypothetical protein
MSAKPHVFQERESGKWFYSFDYQWAVYRSNKGYDTKEAALVAAQKHIADVTR